MEKKVVLGHLLLPFNMVGFYLLESPGWKKSWTRKVTHTQYSHFSDRNKIQNNLTFIKENVWLDWVSQ